MKTIKGITFFDLDGTLLDPSSKITPEIAEAITTLKKNHILPIIATGRTLVEIESILLASGIDSAIVMNGQFIQVEGKKIYSSEFSYEECQKMTQHTNELGHQLAYYTTKNIWCTEHSETLINAYKHIHAVPPIVDRSDLKNKTVNMMLILSTDGDAYYKKHFPEMTFYRNCPYSIDAVKKGISKGSAVKKLLTMLELTDVPTFAFGDGINDLALFDACQTKIAMGNARPELKEKATFITKKNTDGGIIYALKHFNLI